MILLNRPSPASAQLLHRPGPVGLTRTIMSKASSVSLNPEPS